MICFKCGAEIPEGSTICPVCHADLTLEFAQIDPQETGSVSGGGSPASETAPSSGSLPSVPEEPKPGKKGMKILIAAGVVAAAGAAAAFAFTRMNAKDPKEAVVDAFQTAFSHEQVSPAEDIFGLSQFSSASVSSDAEAGLTLSLDSSSMEELNALTGGGLRISSRNDVSNKKSDANVGVVYNGMDVVNLDLYYGDHTLMAAIPELSEKVLTMDLGDGLADRIKIPLP
ncbi:MAG: zinc-ribbon domain-containing protein [Clostridium sp.]